MHRRRFIAVTPVLAASGALALAACTTTPPSSDASPQANAGRRRTIDADVDATMTRLYETVKGSRELVALSVGMLVFPRVIAAGFWFGGQYGQGALRVGSQTSGYYSITAASFGLQIGAQSKAVVLLFMTKNALDEFVRSQGWAAGVDATVALVKIGANGNIDTSTATSPVEAIVMTNAGLMAGVSLEGSKISRLII
ncbi:YSC84-related protein [Paraburkholderia sp. SARCC-3016]|uniref:BPSL1445 family SYLF domain-containing lipoprotein n=1 Tax=Paraburkholderia sp. SARCC-3016 TaxID=3058611 RepID=UPI002806E820|nr:YSC84-related protein [Paraburkholderia sp. SARCC-3016]MDQ7981983.1 YSC84-related protein [Paraburkholderia sp. SARCC-3016]